MRRGVFALTFFLLLATALVDLYAMHGRLVRAEMRNQAVLMDASEAFYLARNFEHDFRRSLALNETEDFLRHWSGRGDLTYGHFRDYPEKGCEQADLGFEEFLGRAVKRDGDVIWFTPIGSDVSCVVLRVHKGGFKTYGVIKSTVCVNVSSPLFLC